MDCDGNGSWTDLSETGKDKASCGAFTIFDGIGGGLVLEIGNDGVGHGGIPVIKITHFSDLRGSECTLRALYSSCPVTVRGISFKLVLRLLSNARAKVTKSLSTEICITLACTPWAFSFAWKRNTDSLREEPYFMRSC
jgi:hypothetical protein